MCQVITDYSFHLWYWFTSSDDNKYDYNNKYVLGIYFMLGTVQSALHLFKMYYLLTPRGTKVKIIESVCKVIF